MRSGACAALHLLLLIGQLAALVLLSCCLGGQLSSSAAGSSSGSSNSASSPSTNNNNNNNSRSSKVHTSRNHRAQTFPQQQQQQTTRLATAKSWSRRRSGDAIVNEVVALANQRVELRCPAAEGAQNQVEPGSSAVPEEGVSFVWHKNNQPLEIPGPRWRLDPINGSLSISSAQAPADEGTYVCLRIPASARSAQVGSSSSSLVPAKQPHPSRLTELKLLVPPRVAPFEFPREAQVGMRLLLTCSALEGQQPLSFVWLKDNQLISTGDQVQVSGKVSLGQLHRRQLAERGLVFGARRLQRISPSNLDGLSALRRRDEGVATGPTDEEREEGEGEEEEDEEPAGEEPLASELNLRVRHADDYSLLSIERLELRHSGRYTCSVENEAARSSFSAQLAINAPPTLTVEPKDQDLVAGQSSTLDCAASGQPKPSISWLRAKETSSKQWDYLPVYENLRFTQLANGSLSIANISLREQGFYLCSAKNGFGPEVSKLIKISVHEPARFPSKYRSLEVRVDERAEVECSATGEQPIAIDWFDKEMKLIGKEDKQFIIEDTTYEASQVSNSQSKPDLSTNHSSYSSRLILTRSGRSHSGQYTCQARNKFGSDKTLINLLVLDVPDKVIELKVTNVTSSTISLRWQLSFTGNSPVTSYLVQYQSDDPLDELLTQHELIGAPASPSLSASTSAGQPAPASSPAEGGGATSSIRAALDALNGVSLLGGPTVNAADEAIDRTLVELTLEQSATNLLIRDLSPFCLYRLRLAAINKIGLGEFSDWIRAKTEEAPPSGSALKLQAAATGPNSVKLTWSPPDRRSWNGQLTGFRLGYRPLDSNFELNKTLEWTPPSIKSLFLQAAGTSPDTATISTSNSQQVAATLPKAPATAKISALANSIKAKSSSTSTSLSSIATNQTNELLELKAHLKQLLALQQQELVSHLTNLQRSTTYLIWIQAINARGIGPQSHSISVRTLDDVPPSAPQLRVQASSTSSLTLTWSLLSNFVSPANQYSLFYRKLPGPVDPSLPHLSLSRWSPAQVGTLAGNSSASSLLLEQQLSNQPLQPEPGPFIERTLSSQQLLLDNNNRHQQVAGIKLPFLQQQQQQQQQPTGIQQLTQFVYVLDQLECGALYELYMTTRNSVGKSEPSALISARTLGEAPQAPANRNSIFARIGSSEVALNLVGWITAGSCPLTHMSLRYKQAIQQQANSASHPTGNQTSISSSVTWPITSNIPTAMIEALNQHQLSAEQHQQQQLQQQQPVPLYLIKSLLPGTCYELEIVAHNGAGHSTSQYEFVTAYANGTRANFGSSRRLSPDDTYTAYRANHQSDDQPYERSLVEQQSFTNQSATSNQLLPVLLMILCFVCLIVSSMFCYYRLADTWKRQRRSSGASELPPPSTRTNASSNHHNHHHHHSNSNSCIRSQVSNYNNDKLSVGTAGIWRNHSNTLKHRRAEHLTMCESSNGATITPHYCLQDPANTTPQQLLNHQKIPSTSSFSQSVSMKDLNLGNSSTLNLKNYRGNRATIADGNHKAGTLRARLTSDNQSHLTSTAINFESSLDPQIPANCIVAGGNNSAGQICPIYSTTLNKQPKQNEEQLLSNNYSTGNQNNYNSNIYDAHHILPHDQYGTQMPNCDAQQQQQQQQETSWITFGLAAGNHISNGKTIGSNTTNYAIPIGGGNCGTNEHVTYTDNTNNNNEQLTYLPAYDEQTSIDACIQQLIEQQYQQHPTSDQQQQYAMVVNQKLMNGINNANSCIYSTTGDTSNFVSATNSSTNETNQQTNIGGAQSIIDSSSSSSGIDVTPHIDYSSSATGTNNSNNSYPSSRSNNCNGLHLHGNHFPPSMVQQPMDVPLKQL